MVGLAVVPMTEAARRRKTTLPPTQVTIWVPGELWNTVQLLAATEGDANTVIIRALEQYVTDSRKQRGRPRSGKYRRLVHEAGRRF